MSLPTVTFESISARSHCLNWFNLILYTYFFYIVVFIVSDTFDFTVLAKILLSRRDELWEDGVGRRAGARYLGLSRTHLKDLFEASRSGRWKSWHSTLWHHQNTTPSQHSAALMAVLKGTFKDTDLQVAAGAVRTVFVQNWSWMNST